MKRWLAICLFPIAFPALCQAWTETNGGDHGGEDWIVTNGAIVGGSHYNVGAFTISNGFTATLLASNVFLVTAATVRVDGVLNGNGKGWPQRVGTGKGTDGTDQNGAGGGGYGGPGGNGEGGFAGGTNFGSTTGPVDMGSGGGYGSVAGSEGGPGGGAIGLFVTNNGTITVNGIVSCCGSNGVTGATPNRAGGGGAGGSIWFDCYQFSGTGTVRVVGGNGGANGGASGGGGGGGRIAVYSTNSTFTGYFYVDGGAGGQASGAAQSGYRGTLYQLPTSWTPGYGGDHGGADWVIGTNTVVVGGLHYNIGSFVVSNGAMAMVIAPRGSLVVTASTARVSGTLSANGSGFETSQGTGKGADGSDQNGAGGGGYGGAGGNGESGYLGGFEWGNPDTTNEMYYPDDIGSGGGYGSTAVSAGGAGGGAIKLVATNSGTIIVDGTISCVGSNGLGGTANKGGGGGSGGSIWLDCYEFSGTGTVSAVGGAGGANGGAAGGGGGGGRIAVWSSNSTFAGTFAVEGGTGGIGDLLARAGQNGTLYQSSVSWNSKTGGDHQGADWIIGANTTVGGIHYNVGSFVISNGITATVILPRGYFAVTAATIQVSGTLSGNGCGSEGGYGTGKGTDGIDQNGAGGGGYGGAGGNGESGYLGGIAWGSPDTTNEMLYPDEAGSGGGSGSTALSSGGAGGGAIKLVATNSGTIIVDGTISCVGSNGLGGTANKGGGGGSGGSIWIDCGTLTGTGTVSAAGGSGGYNGGAAGGGGGGGRIAVYCANFLFIGTASVEGGSATSPAAYGRRGTVYAPGCWFTTIGGDHGGADWIIGTNTFVGGTHFNIGRFAVSNGTTATLLSPEGSFAVTAATVEVYGSINAAGKGSAAGTGQGKNTGAGGGGGYGGAGGNYQSISGGGPAWGTPDTATAMLYPTNWGSGGAGAAGGGVIRLTTTNNGAVLINGRVSADGSNASSSGGGSGGSIWLECSQFSGTGTVSSVGGSCIGSYGGGGGGGRIAAYFTNTAFTGTLTVEGGAGGDAGGGGTAVQGQDGRRGTIYVSPVGWFATLGGDHGGADWVISNNMTVAGSHWNIGRFVVNNGVTNTVISPNGTFAVTAATVEVYGTITAGSSGSLRSEGTGKGQNTDDYDGPGGGGYGGAGGNGQSWGLGGGAWGTPDITNATMYPTNWGSGGGCGGRTGYGGRGGGVIHLIATNYGTMVVDGTISSDGGNGYKDGQPNAGGGGSGGSIWLECGDFIGTGNVSAIGGNGNVSGSAYGGGGGGGRIAVHFTNTAYTGAMTVNGGSGANYGAKGTIYLTPVGWMSATGGDHGGADWIIASNISVGGVHWNIGRFVVSNGVTASLLLPDGSFAVTAATLEVYGAINADGKGSVAGSGPGKNTGSGGGGGYGGAGGHYNSGSGGGPAWGTPDIATATLYPTNFGSGGSGGAGGGVIRLTATNSGAMFVDGTISANGGSPSSGSGQGGGSGGSIWLECGQFNGTGTVSAVGGDGAAYYAGGGGGGRIAVHLTDTAFTGGLSVNGGAGGGDINSGATGQYGYYGSRGTIYVTPIGWIPCLGGDHGGADWIITNNTTIGGSHFNIGRFAVSNGATVSVWSPNGTLALTSATVEVYGTINASSKGSVRNDGTGKGGNGDDYDGPGGGGYGGAGGNGQSGRVGGSAWGSPDTATATMFPTNCGSGGGNGGRSGLGGAGGGAVRFTTTNHGAIVINGTIAANGGNGGGSGANVGAGGSGGSIWLECGSLSGTGTVRAIGGNGVSGTGYGGGGGGGRIAAYFHQTAQTFTNSGGTFGVAGGSGANAGGIGTIYLVSYLNPAVNNAGGPTNVTATNAWLNGTLLFTGGVPTEVWIYWGTADGGTNKEAWATNAYMGTLGTGLFSQVASDMSPGAPYFYRCYATNAYGDAWAESSFRFETLSSVTASNGPATGVTQTNATLGAGLTSGGFGELRIYWGLTDGDTNAAAWQHTNSLGVVQMGTYRVKVAVLAGAPYFYRVYVTNALSEDWADETALFATPVPAVALSALPAGPIVENGAQATVTATLSAPSVSNVTVNFSFGGSATKDADYTSSADSVMIAAGALSTNIILTALDDAEQEEDEMMTVGILSLACATNGSPASVSPMITSDDLEVSNGIGVSGLTPGSATLNGVLTKGDSAAITVFWGDDDGGTTLGSWDSTNVLGVRVEDAAFSTNITGLLAQKTYYYRCYATNSSLRAEDWADSTATFTTPMPAVTLTNLPGSPIAETGGVATVTAKLSAPSISNITVNFSFGGVAVKNTDYSSSADSVTITAGTLSSNITLTALDDAEQEEDETIVVGVLSLVNATNGSPVSVTPVVTSDDPEVTNGSGASGIGQTNATLNGVLTKGDTAIVTVFWGDNDGQTNFMAWDATNVLGARTEDVAFSNKIAGLLANRIYYYRCYSTNSSILAQDWADSTASFMTTNPSVSIGDVVVSEGDSGDVNAVFTLTVSALSFIDVSVTCTTSNGTATAAGLDYVATNAVVTIPAGQSNATFTVKVNGDKEYETPDEVFFVNLAAPAACAIADAQGQGTIADDDLSVHLKTWKHRMKIIFTGYDKPETLTNFPALVVLRQDASGFIYSKVASPVGGDLRFANSNEMVFLNYEIERWDVPGNSYAWVQVPRLLDSNTFIWAYWGNPDLTNPPAYTTNGATWSQGYTAVWHCAQSSGTAVSNARPAGVKGTLQNGSWDSASRIGYGLQINNVDPGVAVGALGFSGAAPRTISGWVRQSVTSAVSRSIFGFSGATMFDLGVSANGSNWVLAASGWEGIATGVKTNSEWYYLSGTYDGNSAAVYVNGVQCTNSTRGALAITDNFKMGDRGGWAGSLDEIRVSTVPRSANWEWASWMNVASNSQFCTMLRYGYHEGTVFLIR